YQVDAKDGIEVSAVDLKLLLSGLLLMLVPIKKTNDIVRLQALIDRRKVIITEDTVRQALRLDDADKRTSWNEFSSCMASAVICLETVNDDDDDDVADDVVDVVADVVANANVEPTPPSPTHATTPPHHQELISSTSQVVPTPPPSPYQSLIAQPSSPPQQQQPSHPTTIFMDLLNTLLETCKEIGEKDKVKSFKVNKIKEGGKIAKIDADEDVTLEEVVAEVAKDADAQGRVPEETATPSVIVHSEPKSKDKGKGILVEESKPLKKQAQIEQDEAYARELEAELNANINWNKEIKQVKRKEKQGNAVMRYQALDRKLQTKAQAKKNIMVYVKNMAGFKMDFFKEPKNFSDDFLLNTLKTIFEKPNVEAHIWKSQRGSYGLAKVKSWKLLVSCGVHIITFTTTQMILLPLTRFTLDQMLNNVRLEVKEESKVSLELLRFVRRLQQEGYRPDFGVDAVEDFKEYILRDYYYWLKTYYCWYKLKLLDNAADSRLRLLEESVAADKKIKIVH
nr:hypothetical protein [Tanacetum cinerariifolium]